MWSISIKPGVHVDLEENKVVDYNNDVEVALDKDLNIKQVYRQFRCVSMWTEEGRRKLSWKRIVSMAESFNENPATWPRSYKEAERRFTKILDAIR